MSEDVDTHHVTQAESAGFWPTEGCAGQSIDFFDSHVQGLHKADGVQQGEGAYAIADEIRRVFGDHDCFAEALGDEVFDGGDGGGIVSGVGMTSRRRM